MGKSTQPEAHHRSCGCSLSSLGLALLIGMAGLLWVRLDDCAAQYPVLIGYQEELANCQAALLDWKLLTDKRLNMIGEEVRLAKSGLEMATKQAAKAKESQYTDESGIDKLLHAEVEERKKALLKRQKEIQRERERERGADGDEKQRERGANGEERPAGLPPKIVETEKAIEKLWADVDKVKKSLESKANAVRELEQLQHMIDSAESLEQISEEKYRISELELTKAQQANEQQAKVLMELKAKLEADQKARAHSK